jgi:hypothetical protein
MTRSSTATARVGPLDERVVSDGGPTHNIARHADAEHIGLVSRDRPNGRNAVYRGWRPQL